MDFFVSDLTHKKENIFHNIDFTNFWQNLSEAIKGATERYWEEETNVILFAINDFKNLRDEYFVKNNDFFTSQIRIDNHKPIVIRLDNEFVNNFLNYALEADNKVEELKNLTPLEVKILNNFCEYLYRQIQDLLIPVKQVKLSDKSEKNINIVL